jgi:hypothetical protein
VGIVAAQSLVGGLGGVRRPLAFLVLAAVDLSVAPIAEHHCGLHHHHIAERYGLFT